MQIERAQELLRAATLCLEAGLLNSAASRAFYAMFQGAQVALDRVGVSRSTWSHPVLQAALTTELIHRRKLMSAQFRDYLFSGLAVRHAADYGSVGIGVKVAQRSRKGVRSCIVYASPHSILNEVADEREYVVAPQEVIPMNSCCVFQWCDARQSGAGNAVKVLLEAHLVQ